FHIKAGSAATEVMTILGSGNVGIGTTSPQSDLNIEDGTVIYDADGSADLLVVTADRSDASEGQLGIYSTTSFAIDKGGSIALGGKYRSAQEDLATYAKIVGAKETTVDAAYGGYLSFYTRANGASPSEQMRITSAGNVGIGTTSPVSLLDVVGNLTLTGGSQNYVFSNRGNGLLIQGLSAGTIPFVELFTYDGDGTDNNRFIIYGVGNPNSVGNRERLILGYNSGGYVEIDSDAAGTGTQRPLSINPSGANVGIGTTNPARELVVASAEPDFLIEDTTSTDSSWLITGANDRFEIFENTTVTDSVLRIDAGGNVGINQTSPSGTLHVTNANTDFVVMPDGNVGIGTTVPTDSLVVAGNANVTGNLVVGADGSGNLAIGTSTTSFNLDVRSGTSFLAGPSDHSIQDTYVILGRQNSDLRAHNISGQHSATASANYLSFAVHDTSTTTSTTEVMRLRGDGNVGIGTTSPSQILQLRTSGTTQLVLDGVQTSDASVGGVIFWNDGDSIGEVRVERTGANDAGDMIFATQANGESLTEQMRIDSSGNVGIGTTSPDDNLDVSEAGTGSHATVEIQTYNDEAVGKESWINLRKSHSDTLGTLTPTIDTETLGSIYFRGVDSGSSSDRGARIYAVQNGAAGTYVPTDLFFQVSDGTNDHTVTIQNDGNVG
ncbi:MAG: hypothetical protein QF535_23180, partial [Anaerolineales bacterium]|nr:hypothetical protein [Anaerolineales bacterium]